MELINNNSYRIRRIAVSYIYQC